MDNVRLVPEQRGQDIFWASGEDGWQNEKVVAFGGLANDFLDRTNLDVKPERPLV